LARVFADLGGFGAKGIDFCAFLWYIVTMGLLTKFLWEIFKFGMKTVIVCTEGPAKTGGGK
jgi:hypothetical protein